MRAIEFLIETALSDVERLWDSLGIRSYIFEKNGTITLSQIIVPKEKRHSGIGTKAMLALTQYADETNQRIVLTPSKDFGGSVDRLTKFYKNFGFVLNKGRNKDFTTIETMIRLPKSNMKIRELSRDS
jgi:predicted GNAT family N-acyltransferase